MPEEHLAIPTRNTITMTLVILFLVSATSAAMKDPSPAVAVEICDAGLWMYKAVVIKMCMVSEGFLPEDGTGRTDNMEAQSGEDAELEAVRSAGKLGVVVMLILLLMVTEAVMLGALGYTVLTGKLFSYLCSCSGLVSIALVVWILCYAGGCAAVRLVSMAGAEGVAAGAIAASAGAAVAAGTVAVVARSVARSYRDDILAKLAGATVGVFSIIFCLAMIFI